MDSIISLGHCLAWESITIGKLKWFQKWLCNWLRQVRLNSSLLVWLTKRQGPQAISRESREGGNNGHLFSIRSEYLEHHTSISTAPADSVFTVVWCGMAIVDVLGRGEQRERCHFWVMSPLSQEQRHLLCNRHNGKGQPRAAALNCRAMEQFHQGRQNQTNFSFQPWAMGGKWLNWKRLSSLQEERCSW